MGQREEDEQFFTISAHTAPIPYHRFYIVGAMSSC